MGKKTTAPSGIKPSPTLERKMQEQEDRQAEQETLQKNIETNMARIKHKIAVISGKGGVGKTTVAANLAVKFAESGQLTGALDVDITGPNLHKLLGVHDKPEMDEFKKTIIPVNGPLNIKIMSTAFLLPDDITPVIWRGPMKMGVLREYLGTVEWGDLDYLIIDLPPGTGDEVLDIMQLVKPLDGVVVVTTSQEMSLISVAKTIVMASKMDVKVLGLVENMSVYRCPDCGHEEQLFGERDGAKNLADQLQVPFLGSIPMEPQVVQQANESIPAILQEKDSPAKTAFNDVFAAIQQQLG
ncbi:MAG TPA: Mrp/NBP35 family ATP-binding protein [Candidatus Lokiarchaeia archaeon]|nr:Mrp/NBP35 family ATP-binding protein [Candidatus Lokiarchaeia archaeon]